MTNTSKQVQRMTEKGLVFSAGKLRRIVVRIASGDILQFREERSSRWYNLPIENGYRIAMLNTTNAKLRKVNEERKAQGLKALRKLSNKTWKQIA